MSKLKYAIITKLGKDWQTHALLFDDDDAIEAAKAWKEHDRGFRLLINGQYMIGTPEQVSSIMEARRSLN